MAINLNGVFNVTHAFLDALRATKGRIVNIASIQSFMHVRTPNSPAYTSAKHGVLGFTRALAAELGKHGVRVNAIGPGLIETPLNAQVRANNPELVKIFLDHTPLGRAGKPEDIAGPAIFLASDLSAYVTGAIVMADGGYGRSEQRPGLSTLLDTARVVELDDRAVALVRQRNECLQRVEFIVLVLVAVGIRGIGIGDQCLRRLGADLQDDRLGLAPSIDAAGAVDDRRNVESTALAL